MRVRERVDRRHGPPTRVTPTPVTPWPWLQSLGPRGTGWAFAHPAPLRLIPHPNRIAPSVKSGTLHTRYTQRTKHDPTRRCPNARSRPKQLHLVVSDQSVVVRMSDYITGTTRPHEPAPDMGPSLAWMGIDPKSMKAWVHLQSFFAAGERTPCAGRPEFTSNRAADKRTAARLCGDCACRPACAEFAAINGETGAVWGGIAR